MIKFEVTMPLDHLKGLIEIAEKEQLSTDAVIRRALINYRLITDGTHKLSPIEDQVIELPEPKMPMVKDPSLDGNDWSKKLQKILEGQYKNDQYKNDQYKNDPFGRKIPEGKPYIIPTADSLSGPPWKKADIVQSFPFTNSCICYLPQHTTTGIIPQCKAQVHVRWCETDNGDA